MNSIDYEPIPPEERKWKYRLTDMILEETDIHGYGWSMPYMAMQRDGFLELRVGYAWDGMSGPGFDTCSSMRGSAVHDALYQAIRIGLLPGRYRGKADAIFRRVNIEEGMNPVRAWWCWAGVRIFGGLWNGREAKR